MGLANKIVVLPARSAKNAQIFLAIKFMKRHHRLDLFVHKFPQRIVHLDKCRQLNFVDNISDFVQKSGYKMAIGK